MLMSARLRIQHVHYHPRRLTLFVGLLAAVFTMLALVNHALAAEEQPHRAAGERLVSIYDGGVQRTIVTRAATVGEALKAAQITVRSDQDVVEPALDTVLAADKYRVNIYRARPVTVVDGAVRRKVTTARQTPQAIAQAAGITLYNEDAVRLEPAQDLARDGATLVMRIERATEFTFVLFGKPATVRTRTTTVNDFLRQKQIRLTAADVLSVDGSTPITPGLKVELWRNGTQTVTTEEPIEFPIEQIKDANREAGKKEVKQPGARGVQQVTYEIDMKNGVETRRTKIASVTTKQPIKQIELIGTKQAAMPYAGGGSKDQWLAASAIPQDQWGYAEWLVQKESGWNPNARNASSGACGLAQALPCSKVPGNPLDPVNSLNWMNSYIMGRYGSWANAVNHSKSKGWY